jgi:hypothetical protein
MARKAGPMAEKRADRLLSTTGFRLGLLLGVGVSLVFGFQQFYPTLIGPLSNVFPSLFAGVAFVSSFLCTRKYGLNLRYGFQVVWFLFTLGTGLWVLAELSWATYYFILDVEVPYPSVADIFYLAGYVPMILGLVFYFKTFSAGMTRRRLALAGVTVASSAALVVGVVLPIEFSSSLPLFDAITNLSYPILDLSLLSITILSLAIFFGGTLARWWVLFAGASVSYIVADELFLYQVAAGTYYNGSFDDLFFLLGYLLFALAFYAHRKEF